MKPIYIIAGEASGDLLGAQVMKAYPCTYIGVGGNTMSKQQDFQKFFDSSELSVMGIMEVLPHIPRLLKKIRQTVDHIIETQPKALITIDAPDFNTRVLAKLRKHPKYKASPFPCIHIGAPTVWAWRPKRAQKVAKRWDELWTLFPFEPPYFPDLPTYFIGHPLGDTNTHFQTAREPHTCLLLPGSRVGEIQKHWPLLQQVCEQNPQLTYVLLTLPHLIPVIKKIAPIPAHCILHTSYDMGRAHIALAASGTVCLELAKAGTPMVTFYRVNALTAWIARQLIKTPYVNLINILLKKPIVPELLQNNATPIHISQALRSLNTNTQKWKEQHDSLGQAIDLLQGPAGSFHNSIKERLIHLFGPKN